MFGMALTRPSLPPAKEEVNEIASVCLSVIKIAQKRVHGFG